MVTGEQNTAYPESPASAKDELCNAMVRSPGLLDDDPSPMQIALLRGMSGQQRLKLAEALYWAARKMKAAGVRSQHLDWPEDKVVSEVNHIFLNARS